MLNRFFDKMASQVEKFISKDEPKTGSKETAEFSNAAAQLASHIQLKNFSNIAAMWTELAIRYRHPVNMNVLLVMAPLEWSMAQPITRKGKPVPVAFVSEIGADNFVLPQEGIQITGVSEAVSQYAERLKENGIVFTFYVIEVYDVSKNIQRVPAILVEFEGEI